MKYYFVINPAAGTDWKKAWLLNEIETYFANTPQEHEVYVTQGVMDACQYTKRICQQAKGEIRIFACGGDGTLNEVVNGAKGYPNVQIGVIPCGTGNDFVKNFGAESLFWDIAAQIAAPCQKVDVLEVDGRRVMNICNIGFDADVAYHMRKFKRLGRAAYTLSIAYCLFKRLGMHLDVGIDQNEQQAEQALLCVLGNGFCYGGQYKGAPLASVFDGKIDLCLIRKLSRLRFARFVGRYKRGEHIEDPGLRDLLLYKTCREVTISSPKVFSICLDGEVFRRDHTRIRLIRQGVCFVVPAPVKG